MGTNPAPIKRNFVAWRLRLKRGIKSATDGELVAAIEWLESAVIVSAGLVCVGIALELALALVHPAYDSLLGVWGRFSADVLMALGVVGVIATSMRLILCQSELLRRSNQRVSVAARIAGEAAERAVNARARAAEANERAAQAELALEKYRSARAASGEDIPDVR